MLEDSPSRRPQALCAREAREPGRPAFRVCLESDQGPQLEAGWFRSGRGVLCIADMTTARAKNAGLHGVSRRTDRLATGHVQGKAGREIANAKRRKEVVGSSSSTWTVQGDQRHSRHAAETGSSSRGERLRRCAETDTVARISGRVLRHPAGQTSPRGHRCVPRIDLLCDPFSSTGSCERDRSLGSACILTTGTPEALVKNADIAMFRPRRRRTRSGFSKEMSVAVVERQMEKGCGRHREKRVRRPLPAVID